MFFRMQNYLLSTWNKKQSQRWSNFQWLGHPFLPLCECKSSTERKSYKNPPRRRNINFNSTEGPKKKKNEKKKPFMIASPNSKRLLSLSYSRSCYLLLPNILLIFTIFYCLANNLLRDKNSFNSLELLKLSKFFQSV